MFRKRLYLVELRCLLLFLVVLSFYFRQAVSYYTVNDESLSHTAAQAYCQDICHSNLVSFHSNITFNGTDIMNTNGYWIGLTQQPRGQYPIKWKDNTDYDYRPAMRQDNSSTTPNPNNVFQAAINKQCVYISINHKWRISPDCETERAFICNNCDSSYYISQNVLTWQDSQNYCVDQCDSNLASIHSQSDQDLMIKIADEYGALRAEYGNIWIGLNGNYTWRDGSSFTFGSNLTGYLWRNPQHGQNQKAVQLHIDDNYLWDSRNLSDTESRFACNHCNGKINKYVLINRVGMDYVQAQEQCMESLGTSLASIHNDNEYDEAKLLCQSAVNSNDGNYSDCYIGFDKINQSQYSNIDGSKMDYAPFIEIVKSNSIKPEESAQICGYLQSNAISMTPTDSFIYFNGCNDTLYAICNSPSEIGCGESAKTGWHYVYGGPTFEVGSTACLYLEDPSMAIRNDKHWINIWQYYWHIQCFIIYRDV